MTKLEKFVARPKSDDVVLQLDDAFVSKNIRQLHPIFAEKPILAQQLNLP